MSLEGIILLGAPRSGTTLLRRILDAHVDIACPGETNVFSGCARFLQSDTISEGLHIGAVTGLGFAGFSEKEVLERLREFAFSFHREYAAKHGKKIWASKTAFDLFHLPAIERLCGDRSRFICIQRHGLDVACSIAELCEKNGGYLAELHEYVKRHPRPMDAFAHAWVDLQQSLRAFVERHPENVLLIKYEELVASPELTMQHIAEFVGVAWSADWLAAALGNSRNIGLGDWKTYQRAELDSSSIGRWKCLSAYEAGRLASICNGMLESSGYDPLPVETERSEEEARRRYEFALRLKAGLQMGKKNE